MATSATVESNIATKLAIALAGVNGARMSSDLSSTLEAVAAGEARFQVRLYPGPLTEVQDSNMEFYPAVWVEIAVHYHLGAAEAESTRTTGSMLSEMEVLLNPDWWSSITGVYYVDHDPESSNADIERIGNVISYAIRTQLTVDINA